MINGQRNTLFLVVENKSDRNITLETIAGSVHNLKTDKLVKNVGACYITFYWRCSLRSTAHRCTVQDTHSRGCEDSAPIPVLQRVSTPYVVHCGAMLTDSSGSR